MTAPAARSHQREARCGATLLELMVVLLLLAVVLGLSLPSLGPITEVPHHTRSDSIEVARRLAIRSGAPVVLRLDSAYVRFLPDGRVLGRGFDPISGLPE